MDEAEIEDEDDDVAEEPDLEDEEGAEALLAPAAEQTEQFNEQLKDRLKGNVDRFEEMVVHEEEIRLGDEGWKGRYYKVIAIPWSIDCNLIALGGHSLGRQVPIVLRRVQLAKSPPPQITARPSGCTLLYKVE